MISSIISRIVILLFGTLYPAYASYKAVRTKNVKEYVKWMMYWIVFALFTCAETFTDVFFSWFPFYYEVKILMVIWLLSPATKGSSILYRKFVHPALCRREQEIDEYISKAKDQGYHTVLNLGTKGVNYATNVIMQTAIKGGGGLVQQLRKSYSLSDLTMSDDRSDRSQQELDEVDDVVSMGDHRVVRRSVQGRASRDARGPRTMSAPRMDMIFAEVDVDRHSGRNSNSRDNMNLSHIRSSEDISGPYPTEKSSSQDALTRTASVGGASTRTRSKVVRSTFTSIKRPGAAEDEDVLIEELEDDLSLPSMVQNIPSSLLSDGTLCLPNSNDMLMHYLRNLMEKDLQEKNNSDVKERTDDDYEIYLKLKEKFESESKSDKSTAESSKEKDEKEKNDAKDEVADKKVIPEAKIPATKGKELVDETEGVKSSPSTDTSKTVDKDISKSNSAVGINIVPDIKEEIVAIVKDVEGVSRKLSESSSSSVQMDQVLKLGDSLVPNFSIIRSTKSTEEITSIGASSSALSSDDELSEFATPSSSPKMKTKVKKMAKHKKRHAPPPPQIKLNDDSSENIKEDSKSNTLKELHETKPEPTTKTAVSQNEQIKINDVVKEKVSESDGGNKNIHASPKSGFKGVSSLSKLMHLPTKLSFWGSSDEQKKGHSESKSKQPTSDDGSKDKSDSAASLTTNALVTNKDDKIEKVPKKICLDSDEESFQDANDDEQNVKPENADNNSGKNIWNADDKPESVHLEAKDTTKPVDNTMKTKVEDTATIKNENATKTKDEVAVKTETIKNNEDSNKTTVENVATTNIDSKDYTYIPLRIATISVNPESTSTDV